METFQTEAWSLSRRELLGVIGGAGALAFFGPSLVGCASPASAVAFVSSNVPRATAGALGSSSLRPFGYRLLDRMGTGNAVLSPFSIAVVLAMIGGGAVGATAGEFEKLLGSPIATLDEELNATLQALDKAGRADTVALTVANSVWAQRDLAWVQAYLDSLARYFGAGVNTVDFRTQSAGVVDAINSWAKDQTKGLIPKIVTPDMITADTRMALANAIHFKGAWEEQFDPKSTTEEPFTTAAGTQVRAQLMHNQTSLRYRETADWRGVSLPFKGGELAMCLVLPERVGAGLAETMADSGFEALLKSEVAEVNLAMPRWKFRLNVRLEEHLAALGLKLAFDPDAADFSGMTAAEKLFLGFVVHEATITVDETGAEAAAVTVGGMRTTAMPAEIKELRLDQPFYYAIAHVPSGTLLFTGRVADPTVTQ